MKIDTGKVEIILAEQGISKKMLSERCGVSRQSISVILRRGTCEPKTVGKLAEGLGINVKEIISGGKTE